MVIINNQSKPPLGSLGCWNHYWISQQFSELSMAQRYLIRLISGDFQPGLRFANFLKHWLHCFWEFWVCLKTNRVIRKVWVDRMCLVRFAEVCCLSGSKFSNLIRDWRHLNWLIDWLIKQYRTQYITARDKNPRNNMVINPAELTTQP